MYNWFYWFVPFYSDDESWIKLLTPLFPIAMILGILASLIFIYTKTGEPNYRKQNKYWWIIYLISVLINALIVWIIKLSIERSFSEGELSFDLGGVFISIIGSWIYLLIGYYIFTNIFRRFPKHNSKRYLPTFVYPHCKRVN